MNDIAAASKQAFQQAQ